MNTLGLGGYYSDEELSEAGFRHIGRNVKIARSCSVIGTQNITIQDDVRIDGYCTLTAAGEGYIEIGSHVHVGSYSFLGGSAGISLSDFVGISHYSCILSQSDDFSGRHLTTAPNIPVDLTAPTRGPVVMEPLVSMGARCIVLPALTIQEGCAVGASTFVNRTLQAWGVYIGVPARRVRDRERQMKLQASRFLSERQPKL